MIIDKSKTQEHGHIKYAFFNSNNFWNVLNNLKK